MIKKLFTTLFLLTTVLVSNAQTNDTKNFFDKSRFVFTLEEEFRGKAENNGLFYEHTDVQAKFLVNKYLDFFTDYRLILQDKSGNGFKDQSVFLEGFDLKLPESNKWGKINLRTRLEIGLNDKGVDDTYQLNVFPKYNTPWKFTRFQFNPFVAEELSFDTMNSFEFLKNRTYVGFDWTISKHIKASTYCFRETNQTGNRSSSDVAVQQIKFVF